MKKVLSIVLAALMATALLAGCGSARPTAKQALTKALDALQKADQTTVDQYFESASDTDTLGEVIGGTNDETSKAVVKTLFSGLAYEIKEVKEDGDTATATVTFTNKDMQQVLGAFLQNLFTAAFQENASDTDMTDEMSAKFFADAYNKTSGTVSNTITLQMNYTAENGWKIGGDTDFADAVTGGFITAISKMQSMMQG